ncbi:MAG: AraC family transcriptional regulator, partial [Gammaproteobacteria bacterium]
MVEHPDKFPHLIATWAVAVAQALDEIDLDSKAIFAEAGIDLIAARDPTMRFPAAKMTQVYDLAEKFSDDPAFGLSIARFIHPTSLHALGYSLFASRTMETFCRRIVRYFRLVTTNAINQFEETESDFRLIMVPAIDRTSFVPQDTWLATIMRFGRHIYRPDFAPLRVGLRRPEPQKNKNRFTEYFRAPIDFGCDTNMLVFNKHEMQVQLPAANAELARQNDQVVLSLLARM